ncbi:preprotein translocase subunit SecG [Teredinibacter waterburyi]|jgi:protein translocase subunit secG|uniref:preprotein translocase subunit SecG n=1 Tax=Teredinibacter waterburyi TaxID=1500538 RepID=UPI00165FD6FC|nr:preprotein translocase subunit SecG [Teredinibacter waterburyi]
MENILLVVHLLVAFAIIGLIMLQQGKGADMGASFGGGASQTLFGSAGAGNFFSRMTAIFATVFFVTSFTLAVTAKQQTEVGDEFSLPGLEEMEIPAAVSDAVSDVPAAVAESVSDVPAALEDAAVDAKAVVDGAVDSIKDTASESKE